MKNMYRKPFYVFASLFLSLFLAFQTNAQTPSIDALPESFACDASTITVHITANDFPIGGVTGISHMLTWDSTVLRIDRTGANMADMSSLAGSSSLGNFNTDIVPNISASLFSATTSNTLGFSWIQFNNNLPQPIADGDTLYSIIFDVVGDISSGTGLRQFPEEERPMELIRPRNVLSVPGSLASEPVDYDGFDITLMAEDTDAPSIDGCAALEAAPIVVAATQGSNFYTLPSPLPWTAPTATDNCGTPTVTTNFNIGDQIAVDVDNEFFYAFTDAAMNSDTCFFTFRADSQATMPAYTVTQEPVECGDTTVTVNIIANNFIDVTQVSHVLAWDSLVLDDVQITNIPNASLAASGSNPITVKSSGATISFAWSGNSTTVPNGDVLYTLVFDIAEGATASSVLLRELPQNERPPNVTSPANLINQLSANDVDYTPVNANIDIIGSGNDTEAPTINNCPASTDTIKIIAPLATSYTVPSNLPWTIPNVTDNCGIQDTIVNVQAGDVLPLGVSTITYSFRDVSGNVSSDCSFFVEILDEDPDSDELIIKVSDELVDCGATQVSVHVTVQNFDSITSIQQSIAWDSMMLAFNQTSFINPLLQGGNDIGDVNTINAGELRFSWSAAIPTSVNFPDNDTLYSFTFDIIGELSSDNPVVIQEQPGTVFLPNRVRVLNQTTPRTFLPGSVASSDDEAPVFTSAFPFNSEIRDTTAGTQCNFATTWQEPTIDDNCGAGDVVVEVTDDEGNPVENGVTLFEVGTTFVIYTLTDQAGNVTKDSFPVIVVDTIVPTVVATTPCPDDQTIIANNATATNGVAAAWDAPNFDDNCPGISITNNFNSGDLFPPGTTTVTYEGIDASGNVGLCEFDITIIPFTLECPEDTTINVNEGAACEGQAVNVDPIVTVADIGLIDSTFIYLSGDNVDTLSGAGIQSLSGTFLNAGVTNVTYEIRDTFGNTQSCDFNITIIDNISPRIICPGVIEATTTDTVTMVDFSMISTEDDCSDSFAYSYILSGATTGAGFNLSELANENFKVGTTTVDLLVDDTNGNVDNCSITVEVEVLSVEVICRNDTVINLSSGNCSAIVNDIGIVVTDTTAIDSMSYELIKDSLVVGTASTNGP
ncbi:MAG: HYR domain-containing protein, partial [Bacteroidota bacterium]